MFLEYTKKKLINKSIVEYLQVKNQDIISISGAGGKTSTIKLLAKNLVREHKKVLITTTTKMFKTADVITVHTPLDETRRTVTIELSRVNGLLGTSLTVSHGNTIHPRTSFPTMDGLSDLSLRLSRFTTNVAVVMEAG